MIRKLAVPISAFKISIFPSTARDFTSDGQTVATFRDRQNLYWASTINENKSKQT
jgi:hypothetical protein